MNTEELAHLILIMKESGLGEGGQVCGNAILARQFCCKAKSALKTKSLTKKKGWEIGIGMAQGKIG